MNNYHGVSVHFVRIFLKVRIEIFKLKKKKILRSSNERFNKKGKLNEKIIHAKKKCVQI